MPDDNISPISSVASYPKREYGSTTRLSPEETVLLSPERHPSSPVPHPGSETTFAHFPTSKHADKAPSAEYGRTSSVEASKTEPSQPRRRPSNPLQTTWTSITFGHISTASQPSSGGKYSTTTAAADAEAPESERSPNPPPGLKPDSEVAVLQHDLFGDWAWPPPPSRNSTAEAAFPARIGPQDERVEMDAVLPKVCYLRYRVLTKVEAWGRAVRDWEACGMRRAVMRAMTRWRWRGGKRRRAEGKREEWVLEFEGRDLEVVEGDLSCMVA